MITKNDQFFDWLLGESKFWRDWRYIYIYALLLNLHVYHALIAFRTASCISRESLNFRADNEIRNGRLAIMYDIQSGRSATSAGRSKLNCSYRNESIESEQLRVYPIFRKTNSINEPLCHDRITIVQQWRIGNSNGFSVTRLGPI